MKHKIYCLKINQKMLFSNGCDYWPYDRTYIIHNDDFHLAPRLYRYYFYMPLTAYLLKALNRIEVKAHREISVDRNDTKLQYVKGSSTGQFTWIDDPNNWRLLIPTHVKGKYENNKAVASFLQYVTTKSIHAGHNVSIELPQISLHTPKRDIEFFCAICTNLPQFYHGECKLGTYSCNLNIDTELPFDDHFRRSLAKSIEEAGGD